MKKIIALIFPIILFGQNSKIPDNVQSIINEAKDHYDVSMFDESKKVLLKLLHSKEGGDFEAEIRYHLGLACYYDGNINDAIIQWNKIRNKYPKHNRSQEINRVLSNWGDTNDEENYFKQENFEYSEDLKTARYFWSPIYANDKLLWSEIKDPEKAIQFYNTLVEKYEDPKKKFQILSYIFLLESGFNSNYYGYKNVNKMIYPNKKQQDFFNNSRYFGMKSVLNKMEEQITGSDTDQNYSTLVRAYYLAGVKLSDNEMFSDAVKVNDKSRPFFEKVIELEKNHPNNIYRIFSEHWMK